MRSKLILVLIFAISTFGIAQKDLTIKKVDDNRLVKVLNSSSLIAKNSEGFVSVKIFKVDNGSASAGFPNSEVSHDLLIAISAFDENPEQNLFEVGPFYNPKFKAWTEKNEYDKEFEIQHGPNNDPTKIKFLINLKELRIIK